MSRALAPALQRLGMPGALGAAVLLGCALFHGTWLRDAHDMLQALQAAPRATGAPALQAAHAGDGGAQLAGFHALFPRSSALPGEVEKLYRLARKAGLALRKGEYRLESSGATLMSYRVALPVRARYANIRRFVDLLLKEMPTASIDRLRFARSGPDDAEVETQLQLTLYFQPRGEAPRRVDG